MPTNGRIPTTTNACIDLTRHELAELVRQVAAELYPHKRTSVQLLYQPLSARQRLATLSLVEGILNQSQSGLVACC